MDTIVEESFVSHIIIVLLTGIRYHVKFQVKIRIREHSHMFTIHEDPLIEHLCLLMHTVLHLLGDDFTYSYHDGFV